MPRISTAVFLSYASEDEQAAECIAATLRSAGIEVWFDKSELRGGEAWDRSIRQQIHECRLFIPVISAQTDARPEGYFRREWKMAVDRTQDMSERFAFLVPVVIDGTSEGRADVPDRFREVQWTYLPAGQTSPGFVERLQRLLTHNGPAAEQRASVPFAAAQRLPARSHRRAKGALLLALVVLTAAGTVYVAVNNPRIWKQPASITPPQSIASNSPKTTFSPPSHSIAVLPFVNMSGDKDQEYFSEGLTEELLNSLSRINELQVAARTSSFSFEGQRVDIATVAHKLNVAAVLEGSVRRSAKTVRVTTQLINGVTGFHLWSQTYDRNLGDILSLQTEIANAVANALRVTLLADTAAKVELGGTHTPAAFDAYLKGSQAYRSYHEAKDLENAISAYTDAIQLDAGYALAYVARSRAYDELASYWVIGMARAAEAYGRALIDARRAIALAPALGEAHLVVANSLAEQLDFAHASEEYQQALSLAPGNALVLQDYGLFAVLMGHTDEGLSASHRAVALDPLNRTAHLALFDALNNAHRPQEAISVLHDALALDPAFFADQWLPYYVLGNYESARATCEGNAQYPAAHQCLAIVYYKLGRRKDAESEFAKYKAEAPDDWPQFASIYAQWGDTAKALSSLEAGLRIRHTGMEYLKTYPLIDSLRDEPRFQAVLRELKFPN